MPSVVHAHRHTHLMAVLAVVVTRKLFLKIHRGPGDLRGPENDQLLLKKKKTITLLFEFKSVSYYYPDTKMQGSSF